MQREIQREDFRDPKADQAKWLDLYRAMVRQRVIEEKLVHLQKQGRIRFFAPSIGQEASTIGSVSALTPKDWVVPALRENAVVLYRGLPLKNFLGQFFGNSFDLTKGRQMPGHFSFRDGKVLSTSTCIATQLTHAVGIAMALQYRKEDGVVLAYLGDGATSEGDFHAAMNFAGVYQAPIVFFCVNNQLAISLPVEKQTASSSLAIKASAYGFDGYQIDGNDVLEVRKTTKRAVSDARKGMGPKFIEAITYRLSNHTASDDRRRYMTDSEIGNWAKKDPVSRFRKFLEKAGVWNKGKEERLFLSITEELSKTLEEVASGKPVKFETLIEDVYETAPDHLREEMEELDASVHGF